MSGGSFDYLCHEIEWGKWHEGVWFVITRLDDMLMTLKSPSDSEFYSRNGLEDVIELLEDRRNKLIALDELVKKETFLELLKSIEWWFSGDWGKENVLEAMELIKEQS